MHIADILLFLCSTESKWWSMKIGDQMTIDELRSTVYSLIKDSDEKRSAIARKSGVKLTLLNVALTADGGIGAGHLMKVYHYMKGIKLEKRTVYEAVAAEE